MMADKTMIYGWSRMLSGVILVKPVIFAFRNGALLSECGTEPILLSVTWTCREFAWDPYSVGYKPVLELKLPLVTKDGQLCSVSSLFGDFTRITFTYFKKFAAHYVTIATLKCPSNLIVSPHIPSFKAIFSPSLLPFTMSIFSRCVIHHCGNTPQFLLFIHLLREIEILSSCWEL